MNGQPREKGEAELAEKKANLERETTEKSQSQAALNEETIKNVAEAAQKLTEAIGQLNERVEKVEKATKTKKKFNFVRDPNTQRIASAEQVD